VLFKVGGQQAAHLESCEYQVVGLLVLQLGTSDNLESKFRALEGGDVEDELAQMKRGVLTGSRTSAPQQLPEGRPIRCVVAFGIPWTLRHHF
jgi:hypothetical protein